MLSSLRRLGAVRVERTEHVAAGAKHTSFKLVFILGQGDVFAASGLTGEALAGEVLGLDGRAAIRMRFKILTYATNAGLAFGSALKGTDL